MPNKPKSEAQGIQLSYRYRIYPTPEQEKALAFEFDACRYVYNHFLRARTESWERTQKTLRRPKLAPGADPNAKHPEYVKDSNGKTVWEECVNESYDPKAKAMGNIPSKELTALKNSCLDEDGNLWLKQADSTALGYSTKNLDAAFDNFFRGIKQGQKIGPPLQAPLRLRAVLQDAGRATSRNVPRRQPRQADPQGHGQDPGSVAPA